jgi:hypothetical protein
VGVVMLYGHTIAVFGQLLCKACRQKIGVQIVRHHLGIDGEPSEQFINRFSQKRESFRVVNVPDVLG